MTSPENPPEEPVAEWRNDEFWVKPYEEHVYIAVLDHVAIGSYELGDTEATGALMRHLNWRQRNEPPLKRNALRFPEEGQVVVTAASVEIASILGTNADSTVPGLRAVHDFHAYAWLLRQETARDSERRQKEAANPRLFRTYNDRLSPYEALARLYAPQVSRLKAALYDPDADEFRWPATVTLLLHPSPLMIPVAEEVKALLSSKSDA